MADSERWLASNQACPGGGGIEVKVHHTRLSAFKPSFFVALGTRWLDFDDPMRTIAQATEANGSWLGHVTAMEFFMHCQNSKHGAGEDSVKTLPDTSRLERYGVYILAKSSEVIPIDPANLRHDAEKNGIRDFLLPAPMVDVHGAESVTPLYAHQAPLQQLTRAPQDPDGPPLSMVEAAVSELGSEAYVGNLDFDRVRIITPAMLDA